MQDSRYKQPEWWACHPNGSGVCNTKVLERGLENMDLHVLLMSGLQHVTGSFPASFRFCVSVPTMYKTTCTRRHTKNFLKGAEEMAPWVTCPQYTHKELSLYLRNHIESDMETRVYILRAEGLETGKALKFTIWLNQMESFRFSERPCHKK